MKKGIVVIIVLIVLVGGFSVLKSISPGTTPSSTATPVAVDTGAPQATTNQILIKGYAFSPDTLTVKVGTKVTWMNQDLARHTITADVPSTSAPASALFGQNESVSFTFSTPGTYTYHCEPHPYMKGTVTVTQ